MLEADDVDDDFFTPTGRPTLASIFGSTPKDKSEVNYSLKYVPPKPQDIGPKETETLKQTEQPKLSECILACPLFAYELVNSSYVPRGKLGFAIMKIHTPPHMKLVLYDSSKNTLSHTTISMKLNIIVHKNNYITYYDDNQINWSLLCANVQECKNIVKELQNLEVAVTYESDPSSNHPAVPQKPLHLKLNVKENSIPVTEQSDKESDTDSSLHRKTKESILNRMAMMGHSILPPQPLREQTSDSSDTNEYNNHKNIRHKPSKTNNKKVIHDKIITDVAHSSQQSSNFTQNSAIVPINSHNPDIIPLFTTVNGKLVPLTHTNITSNTSANTSSDRNDNVNVMLTEQRISNSELRINFNRMSDKIDQILDKVKVSHISDSRNTFTDEIYQKLLLEYENKIKNQVDKIRLLEDKLKTNIYHTIDKSQRTNEEGFLQISDINTENVEYKNKIKELEEQIHEKDDEIKKLQQKIASLSKHKNEDRTDLQEATTDIECLAERNANRDEYLQNLKNEHSKVITELGILIKQNDDLQKNFKITIKGIMNTTFHTLSANFDNNTQYSGDNIKRMIATIIKKITVQNLSDEI